jgi:ADP-ribosylglycohydrolase
MIGALAGDIIGSVHEGTMVKSKEFPLFIPESCFTDDTVLSVALASAIDRGGDYASSLRLWGRRYPDARYGARFRDWLLRDEAPAYSSFGNGSAMRVSPVGWAFHELDTVLSEARKTAEVTHNHLEGIKGAQAVAGAVFLARTGGSKESIRDFLESTFGYDCSSSLEDVRTRSEFDVTCQGTVPAAAVAFLAADDFEDAVRNAVSLGGDADTLACIAGALAEAFFGGVPALIQQEVTSRLDSTIRSVVQSFARRYCVPFEDLY